MEGESPRPLSILDRAAVAVATGLGFGFAPWMPGTVGAIWGLPLAFAVAHLAWPAIDAETSRSPLCLPLPPEPGRRHDPCAQRNLLRHG